MADEVKATGGTPEEGGKLQEPKTEAPLTLEAVKKLIQSETDRVRTEYVQKLKTVESEKETLIKERMTEKERTQFELEQRERSIAEKDRAIADRELALERANVIAEMEIPKLLADFVSGKDRDSLASNAKKLMEHFNTEVLKEVNKRLAGAGPKPQASETATDGTVNWNAIWNMKAGPEKEAALEKAFATLGGQKIPIGAQG